MHRSMSYHAVQMQMKPRVRGAKDDHPAQRLRHPDPAAIFLVIWPVYRDHIHFYQAPNFFSQQPISP
jgi:hypothetical protein